MLTLSKCGPTSQLDITVHASSEYAFILTLNKAPAGLVSSNWKNWKVGVKESKQTPFR